MRTSIVKLAAIVALLAGTCILAPAVSASGPQAGNCGLLSGCITVTVPGNGDGNGNPWVDTGFVLKAGLPVSVTATGTACVDPSSSSFCSGPNGLGAGPGDILLPSASWGSLIGRIDGGAPFAVGAGPTTITGSGALQFAQNDSLGNQNNTGAFQATITFTCLPVNGNGNRRFYPCASPAPA